MTFTNEIIEVSRSPRGISIQALRKLLEKHDIDTTSLNRHFIIDEAARLIVEQQTGRPKVLNRVKF